MLDGCHLGKEQSRLAPPCPVEREPVGLHSSSDRWIAARLIAYMLQPQCFHACIPLHATSVHAVHASSPPCFHASPSMICMLHPPSYLLLGVCASRGAMLM